MKLVCTATIILTEEESTSLYEAKTVLEKLAAEMEQSNLPEIDTVDFPSVKFAIETIEEVLDTANLSEEF